MMAKSAGQIAYEADVARKPRYHDGSSRAPWEKLSEIARWSWERKPAAPAIFDDGLQEG